MQKRRKIAFIIEVDLEIDGDSKGLDDKIERSIIEGIPSVLIDTDKYFVCINSVTIQKQTLEGKQCKNQKDF